MTDPWAVLGVGRSASYDEAHRAYTVRSQLLHPDRHHGAGPDVLAEAERSMRELNEAWSVVSARLSPGAPAAPTSSLRPPSPSRPPSPPTSSPVPTNARDCAEWVLARLVDAGRHQGDPLTVRELAELRLPLGMVRSGRAFERWLTRRRATLAVAVKEDAARGHGDDWGRALRVLGDEGVDSVLLLLLRPH
jgi:hypothetical protein